MKLGRPQETEKFEKIILDGVDVYISDYFGQAKGKDQKIRLMHLYWGDDLRLFDIE